jgi:apolipoprotein N-acyltransferase
MRNAVSVSEPARERRFAALGARARASAPTLAEVGLAVVSAALLILSFPDFNLWPLAWVGLVPLLAAIARRPQDGLRAFLIGWIAGTLFFYGSCYWLTYAMVRYGGIPSPIAYTLLTPGALVVGLFPGLFCLALARVVSRWGVRALFVAPLMWTALEWARLGVTGQLWNAIGYSQAYVPQLIQAARWGGVYLVGFFIVLVNVAIAYALLRRGSVRAVVSAAIITGAALIFVLLIGAEERGANDSARRETDAVVVALQPNVPMDFDKSPAEIEELINRHLDQSERALGEWEQGASRGSSGSAQRDEPSEDQRPRREIPRIVIWPESPMNFTYANDSEFREVVARFSAKNRASVLFNSLEPAPAGGAYNSAVMVNEEGRVVAQYDKIRLLPFGEYVPLPRWLPGVNLVPVMVGDFTPGAEYPLMPLGQARAGVFICFESAFPGIARRFTLDGADVLINISNDGYLGPTPVMRQHLANAIFRAVENGRPVLRVTNTGITAYISERGEVMDATAGFQTATRSWTVRRASAGKTFYTTRGDLFVGACAAISILILAATLKRGQESGV